MYKTSIIPYEKAFSINYKPHIKGFFYIFASFWPVYTVVYIASIGSEATHVTIVQQDGAVISEY